MTLQLSLLTTFYQYKNIINDSPDWSICADFDDSWHGLDFPYSIVSMASNRTDIVSQQNAPLL